MLVVTSNNGKLIIHSEWPNKSFGIKQRHLRTLKRGLNRGFAGRPPELKWLRTSPIFSGFSRLFRNFEGQRYGTFYGKNHLHWYYCDLNANQVCYAFQYVLSYFHNENKLTKLKPFISGRNSIFAHKLQYV